VRAKRERERVLEMAEKEKQVLVSYLLCSSVLHPQLRQAYEETRAAKVRLEEQRKRQHQLGAFGRGDV
jgi:hypothetical protein